VRDQFIWQFVREEALESLASSVRPLHGPALAPEDSEAAAAVAAAALRVGERHASLTAVLRSLGATRAEVSDAKHAASEKLARLKACDAAIGGGGGWRAKVSNIVAPGSDARGEAAAAAVTEAAAAVEAAAEADAAEAARLRAASATARARLAALKTATRAAERESGAAAAAAGLVIALAAEQPVDHPMGEPTAEPPRGGGDDSDDDEEEKDGAVGGAQSKKRVRPADTHAENAASAAEAAEALAEEVRRRGEEEVRVALLQTYLGRTVAQRDKRQRERERECGGRSGHAMFIAGQCCCLFRPHRIRPPAPTCDTARPLFSLCISRCSPAVLSRVSDGGPRGVQQGQGGCGRVVRRHDQRLRRSCRRPGAQTGGCQRFPVDFLFATPSCKRHRHLARCCSFLLQGTKHFDASARFVVWLRW